jgi:hypothetical protein
MKKRKRRGLSRFSTPFNWHAKLRLNNANFPVTLSFSHSHILTSPHIFSLFHIHEHIIVLCGYLFSHFTFVSIQNKNKIWHWNYQIVHQKKHWLNRESSLRVLFYSFSLKSTHSFHFIRSQWKINFDFDLIEQTPQLHERINKKPNNRKPNNRRQKHSKVQSRFLSLVFIFIFLLIDWLIDWFSLFTRLFSYNF